MLGGCCGDARPRGRAVPPPDRWSFWERAGNSSWGCLAGGAARDAATQRYHWCSGRRDGIARCASPTARGQAPDVKLENSAHACGIDAFEAEKRCARPSRRPRPAMEPVPQSTPVLQQVMMIRVRSLLSRDSTQLRMPLSLRTLVPLSTTALGRNGSRISSRWACCPSHGGGTRGRREGEGAAGGGARGGGQQEAAR